MILEKVFFSLETIIHAVIYFNKTGLLQFIFRDCSILFISPPAWSKILQPDFYKGLESITPVLILLFF